MAVRRKITKIEIVRAYTWDNGDVETMHTEYSGEDEMYAKELQNMLWMFTPYLGAFDKFEKKIIKHLKNGDFLKFYKTVVKTVKRAMKPIKRGKTNEIRNLQYEDGPALKKSFGCRSSKKTSGRAAKPLPKDGGQRGSNKRAVRKKV